MHKVVVEIFGEQAIHPYLLGLLSAPASTAPQDTQIDLHYADLLHPGEIAVLAGYRFAKRRAEYLTGRVCAKLAIEELLNWNGMQARPAKLSEIEITPTADGRPSVRVDCPDTGELQMDISISHSGEYGVALAAKSNCGVDLQLQRTSLLRVQEKFCSESEYNLLTQSVTESDPLTRLAFLWAAKEAAKKALSHRQMPGFLELELKRVTHVSGYFALTLRLPDAMRQPMPKNVTVAAGKFENYALAVCLINEDSGNA